MPDLVLHGCQVIIAVFLLLKCQNVIFELSVLKFRPENISVRLPVQVIPCHMIVAGYYGFTLDTYVVCPSGHTNGHILGTCPLFLKCPK